MSARKPLVFTRHAQHVRAEREIEQRWIEQAAYFPDWTEADPVDPTLTRAFAAIAERDNRVLRVIYAEELVNIRIISVFFDRGAKRPR